MEIFAPGEIARIYINFCDPWPVRIKWRKRRLTHVNFLKIYRAVMGDRGEIFFKTDNRELFDFSLGQFAQEGWRLDNVSFDLHAGADGPPPWNIMTEYEEKFSSQGMPIYRLEAYFDSREL
jgi:tRNA (guanine-N7-)-methyltransferase